MLHWYRGVVVVGGGARSSGGRCRRGAAAPACSRVPAMIEVICNDRLGKKIRVKCKCVPPFLLQNAVCRIVRAC